MKMSRNRLLVPLVLIAVLATVFEASVCAASSPYRHHQPTTKTGSTLKPGTGPMSGEPDYSGGSAPLPKVVPTGAASPAPEDSPLWVQMTTITALRIWHALRAIRN